jgi:hypothetical protein
MTEPHPRFTPAPPHRPYGNDGLKTGGGSGSATSRERAVREAGDGTLAARQAQMLDLLADAGPVGLTWKEIGDRTGQHHGQVSGALSNLHAGNLVACLASVRRNRCAVYVLPEHVGFRTTRAFKPNKGNRPQVTLSPDEAAVVESLKASIRQMEAYRPPSRTAGTDRLVVDIDALTTLLGIVDRATGQ